MTFIFEPELTAYMREKGLTTVCVEVVTANSDIDCTELYVHTVKKGQAEEFIKRRRYRSVKTEQGEVLLPPYVLEYDDVITLGLRKRWIFRSVTCSGIRL